MPSPTLNFLVGRGRLASSLVGGPLPPNITLILEDTVQIPIGPVRVGRFNGPIEAAIAPIAVYTLPAWALALARAKSAAVKIDSETFTIPQADLRDYQAFYRAAVCDTLPLR